MSLKTTGLAALALGLALTGAARADREPTAAELTRIDAVLKEAGFTKWKKIEVESDEIEVDDATTPTASSSTSSSTRRPLRS